MISDNNGREYKAKIEKNGSITRISIDKETVGTGAEYIEIFDDKLSAKTGEDGYYVIADVNKAGSFLVRFSQKCDDEIVVRQNIMPIVGIKKQDFCALIIAVGMKNCFFVRTGVKNGEYRLALRIQLDKNAPYEDISFEIHELQTSADYNDMARIYREYQLWRGVCRTIKERANEALDYATEAVEIRIRLGWKPAPPKIEEQTIENEPPMHVACTFDRVKDIVDELKKQGVEKAELCLIGWNKSGHDGRWPQIFPVEEKLGGEKKLRELIDYAQKNGYKIVCHTNSTDWYNIAEGFPKDMVVKKADGSYSTYGAWSGGRMYDLCPKKAYEIAKEELPKVADLGFSGLHYIDVMTVGSLRRCYDENHPVTEKETEELYRNIGELSHKLFGGFASEGAYDFGAPYLDYALYITFDGEPGALFDEEIPLWELVYHGIILYNPSTLTVNYPIKSKKSRNKFKAFGGRPSFYFYSHFMVGSEISDWLGSEDLMCDTDEQLVYSVSKIKEAYDEFKKMAKIQREFMISYKKTGKNQYTTEYADGSKVISEGI